MRRIRSLVSLGLALLTACAGASPATPAVAIDLTGADVAQWDSLSRNYAVGPELLGLPLPPMPVPEVMRKSRILAVCTVDERGQLIRLSLSPMKDPAYARKLASEWRAALKFKAARTREGMPTTGYYRLALDL